jgi:hypothetical protein
MISVARIVAGLLSACCLCAPLAHADAISDAAAVAVTATSANSAPAYDALLDREHHDLLTALSPDGKPLTQDEIDRAKQSIPPGDRAWAASLIDDPGRDQAKAADISVLSAFTSLPGAIKQQDAVTAARINHDASPQEQQHAIFDADGMAFLYYLPEALGPKLGPAFLRAYKNGRIGKAVALIKLSEISTKKAKETFNYPRPFVVPGNTIVLVKDEYVTKSGAAYTAHGGAFPSGHTTVGYSDALLLAQMLPERTLPLLARAAGYGYSRIVLGVHYPLDVIGGRMIAERNVAHDLQDAHYRTLVEEARSELRAALEAECGEPLAACARSADAAADPWADRKQRGFYAFTMTYALPAVAAGDAAMEIPPGADDLLMALRPGLSAAERADLIRGTALASGAPLDPRDPQSGFWQRVNLYDAALAAMRH